jgi:hypothetical protein
MIMKISTGIAVIGWGFALTSIAVALDQSSRVEATSSTVVKALPLPEQVLLKKTDEGGMMQIEAGRFVDHRTDGTR